MAKMAKTQAKETAKKILQESIGCAYYKISDDSSIKEEDQDMIIGYINKYGNSMCKAIGVEYVTY